MKKFDLRFNILFICLSIAGVFIYFTYLKGTAYEVEYRVPMWSLVAFTIGGLFTFILENRKHITVAIKCQLPPVRDQKVYVSLSYLFKIKLEGENKYLMVKGNKIARQYQPVGGVYKRYNSSTDQFQRWNASEARNDRENSDDLRFYVKGKYIPKVILWFMSKKNREIDVWREFNEELLATGILPKEHFSFIKAEYLYSRHERLIKRIGIDTKQYLIFDIYTIEFTEDQKQSLEELYKNDEFTDKYAFTDEADLDKGLIYNNGIEYQLGFHARYLIQND